MRRPISSFCSFCLPIIGESLRNRRSSSSSVIISSEEQLKPPAENKRKRRSLECVLRGPQKPIFHCSILTVLMENNRRKVPSPVYGTTTHATGEEDALGELYKIGGLRVWNV